MADSMLGQGSWRSASDRAMGRSPRLYTGGSARGILRAFWALIVTNCWWSRAHGKESRIYQEIIV